MSQQVNLQLPDDLVEQIRRLAESKQRSFEDVAIAAMQQGVQVDELLIETPDYVLQGYTDDQLWAIVDEHLSPAEVKYHSQLRDKGREGKLSFAEETELHALTHKINFQMLERTKALVQLQARGYDIKNGYLKSGKR